MLLSTRVRKKLQKLPNLLKKEHLAFQKLQQNLLFLLRMNLQCYQNLQLNGKNPRKNRNLKNCQSNPIQVPHRRVPSHRQTVDLPAVVYGPARGSAFRTKVCPSRWRKNPRTPVLYAGRPG